MPDDVEPLTVALRDSVTIIRLALQIYAKKSEPQEVGANFFERAVQPD